jgi:hypothetical protein
MSPSRRLRGGLYRPPVHYHRVAAALALPPGAARDDRGAALGLRLDGGGRFGQLDDADAGAVVTLTMTGLGGFALATAIDLVNFAVLVHDQREAAKQVNANLASDQRGGGLLDGASPAGITGGFGFGDEEMTESKQQEIRAKLVELGFWGADETGDPLTSENDAKVIQSRIRERLGHAVYQCESHPYDSPFTVIEIYRLQFSYRIVEGVSFPEAICLAALKLPEFLKQHPECAA